MKRSSTDQPVPLAEEDAGRRVLRDILPYFGVEDSETLRRRIRRFGSRSELRALLTHHDADVARTAAVSLGWVGAFADSAELASLLHHDDYFVVKAAEQALWAIWMRSSCPACGDLLQRAIESLNECRFDEAESTLDKILLKDPDFAEASNQRAILYYLTERHRMSILACRRTLLLNPHHFGAAAGLGHNHFQLGEYDVALAAYRRALAIYPRMEGIRQAMRRTREAHRVCGGHTI